MGAAEEVRHWRRLLRRRLCGGTRSRGASGGNTRGDHTGAGSEVRTVTVAATHMAAAAPVATAPEAVAPEAATWRAARSVRVGPPRRDWRRRPRRRLRQRSASRRPRRRDALSPRRYRRCHWRTCPLWRGLLVASRRTLPPSTDAPFYATNAAATAVRRIVAAVLTEAGGNDVARPSSAAAYNTEPTDGDTMAARVAAAHAALSRPAATMAAGSSASALPVAAAPVAEA